MGNGTLPRTFLFLPYRLQYKDMGSLLLSNCHSLEMNYRTGGHRTGSDPTFRHRRWLQEMRMKVQVLNANLVPMYMPYGDEYHTSSATRSASALVLRPVVVRQPHMGSHPRSVVRNMQAVTVTL
jgi:hypothetical protein